MKVTPQPWRPPPRTLADVRDDPARFPSEVLRGAKTALCLFAAEWHGRQDAYWVAEAGLTATCVDLNEQHLEEMRRIYPQGWEFITRDAFDYPDTLRYDVVTCDPFTGSDMERCHQLMPRWCGMANRAVIMGSTAAQPLYRQHVPEGWKIVDTIRRSSFAGGVYWNVVTST